MALMISSSLVSSCSYTVDTGTFHHESSSAVTTGSSSAFVQHFILQCALQNSTLFSFQSIVGLWVWSQEIPNTTRYHPVGTTLSVILSSWLPILTTASTM